MRFVILKHCFSNYRWKRRICCGKMIEQVHQENISILKYNDENSMSCVLSLAYYAARKDYVMYRELAGGKGFADIVFVRENLEMCQQSWWN